MIYNFFDWDDTIVSSRESIYLSYKKAIMEVSGYHLSWKEYNDSLYHNANAYLAELGYDNETIKNIKNLKNTYYINSFCDSINVIKTDINSKDINFIVTNTTATVVNQLIPKLNLENVFHNVIGSDAYEGVNRKPSPDLYNYAFAKIRKQFDGEKDQIIIYEDSDWGMQAAISFYQEHKNLVKNFKLVYTPIF